MIYQTGTPDPTPEQEQIEDLEILYWSEVSP